METPKRGRGKRTSHEIWKLRIYFILPDSMYSSIIPPWKKGIIGKGQKKFPSHLPSNWSREGDTYQTLVSVFFLCIHEFLICHQNITRD